MSKPKPAVQDVFPAVKRLVFKDTGERRYPNRNEYYFWRNGIHVTGPHQLDEDPDEVSWAFRPDHYAIYTKEEEA